MVSLIKPINWYPLRLELNKIIKMYDIYIPISRMSLLLVLRDNTFLAFLKLQLPLDTSS